MVNWFASLQPALVGGVLLWASAVKLFARSAPRAARRSALATLVGAERSLIAYRAVGTVELVVGGLLVLPPAHPAEGVAAVVLGVGMLGYLGYAKVAAPTSSCGCLGEKHAPVRWRSFARAGLLAGLSVLAVLDVNWWVKSLADSPLATVVVLVAEFAAVVALSPELDRRWLIPLRRLRLRYNHPLAGGADTVPVEATVQQLRQSHAYCSVTGLLRSDLLDTWDEGEWRILTYSARGETGPATAVFAVPRLRYDPDLVRVVLVADEREPVTV
jgi:hypothetical protein